MQPPETKAGPGAATPEPRCNAHQATAVLAYSQTVQGGNRNAPGADPASNTPAARPGLSRLEGAVGASGGQERANCCKAAYRDSEGRKWGYRGKRARVLDMLVASPGGITQWDCLPWHTRLGASIHAMREDGLEISTELEGEYRHARYRLATKLFGDDLPGEHRPGGFEFNHSASNAGGHVG